MRFKEDILRDIKYSETLDAQLRLNSELLLDIRSALLCIAPEAFFTQTPVDERKQPEPESEPEPQPEVERDPNDLKLKTLPMSARLFNVLNNQRYKYLSDLEGKIAFDFLKHRNFGKNLLAELRELVAEYGMTIPDDKD
jgi:DNA-directed RNA polymerase alpha subunit